MKIETLTTQQKAMMPAWRDKWVAKGLSTDPVDFEKIEAAAMAAYALIGAKRPRVILRMSSPYAASVAGAAAWLALKCASGDTVGDTVGSQVRDKVVSQVWASVSASVRAQVWAQVGAQVREQVRVREQVGSPVWDQVWAHVGDEAKEGFSNYGASGILWASFCAQVSFFRDVCNWRSPAAMKRFALAEALSEAGWTWWHSDVFVSSDRPAFIKRDDEGRLHSETGHAIEYRDGWGGFHAGMALEFPMSG